MAAFTAGHIHAGGLDISLRDSTTNHNICTGTATYHTNPPHLATINPCLLHEKIVRGEDYTVTARYDNSAPVPGAMAIMMTYVWWGTQ